MLTDGPFHGEGGCLPTSSLQLCCSQVKNLIFVQAVLIVLFLLLPPWALCHWNLKAQRIKGLCLVAVPCRNPAVHDFSDVWEVWGERCGFKRGRNCFIDALYFFDSCFLSVCFVSCRTLPSFPCPDSLFFSFPINHEGGKRLVLPSWFLLFSPPCWGGQAQPLLSLCPWDRAAWCLCPSPHEPFVLVKQALSVASEPVFSQSWFLWVRNNGDWFSI